jgi:hypothetical protein
MSSIMIHDLEHSADLDSKAMSAVRGGSNWGPNVNVNLNVDQKIAQVQDIQLNVLNNNGVIGAGFTGPKIDLNAQLMAKNNFAIPAFA